LNRSIQTLLVASPIPDLPDSIEIRSGRFDIARRTIGAAPDLILPYDPFMCFQETILADEQSRSLAKGYKDLTDRLISKNGKDVLTLLNLAVGLREAGEMELAELKYQEILDMHPDSGDAWFEYGRFARISRDLDKAAEAFARSASFARTKSKAYSELILTKLQMGRFDQVKIIFNSMLSEVDSPIEFLRLAEVFADRGNFDEASEAIARSASIDDEYDLDNIWVTAQIMAGRKEYAAAFAKFDKWREAYPTMLAAVFNAGAMAAFAGKVEAKGLLQKSIELFEATDKHGNARDNANVYSSIAFAYEYLGEASKAINSLRQSLIFAEKAEKRTIFLFPEYKYVAHERFATAIANRLREIMERPISVQ
jgi:tetratricopeptide (TPR) repeat protein